MANESNNDFTDILSAALDESGITGDFEDEFDETSSFSHHSVYPGQSQPIISNHVFNGGMPQTIPIPQQIGGINSTAFNHPIPQPGTPFPSNQLITQVSKVQNNPSSLLHRSASSPAIIRIPASSLQKQGESPLQSQIKLQTSQNQNNSTGGPRIIKITRLGGQGSSTIKVPVTGNIPLSGIVNKATGGAVKIGNYVTKSSSVPTINLNDLSGRTNGSGVPVSDAPKSGPESINWASLVKKDPNTGACTINLANLAAASGKKIIITTTTGNQMTGSVISQSAGTGEQILSSGLGTNSPIPTNLGSVRMTQSPSVLPRSDILSAQTMRPRGGELPAPHSPGMGSVQLSSFTPSAINTIHSQSVSLLQRNPPLHHSMSTPALPDLGQHRSLNGPNGSIPPNYKANVTHKDISRLWSNEDVKLKKVGPSVQQQTARQMLGGGVASLEEEEVEDEVQELGHAETYNEYMPVKLSIGIKHPDPVVETSSLASVEPCNIWYNLSLPENIIDNGELSALQLEAITYACQRHEIIMPSKERAGFLIGDGAGVGKGRTLAGIIYENYLLGRKRALWLSVSNDLKVDAERDLRDIGAGRIEVHALNKFKYAKISSKENGSVKKGVIFATYSSLIGESQSSGKYKTRFKQLLKWCGKDFDGVIVFDECHKAKNLCPVGSSKPTKTGQTVLELQNRLPNARIVYASATGASEPKNMAYMTRLGLWGPGTPFPEFNDFIQAVEKRGVGAMELVAMDMKLRGMYIARQLSFKGVTFKIEEIPLAKDFIKVYNDSVKMWVTARERFSRAAELMDAEQRMKKSMWGQFWSAHQRFFKYLCISAKVNHCVELAREAIKTGKCVVIGLQSTGEARTLEQLEEQGGELTDFVSTAKGVFQTLVEKHFPAPDRRKTLDIFGLGEIYGKKKERESVQQKNENNKRKKEQKKTHKSKKQKKHGSDSDNSSSDSSDSDSDISDLEFDFQEDSDDSDSDVDDFNPFGNDSDSDEDPWLKKSSKKTKKKDVNKKKKKKSKGIDMDTEFDKALAAAGLLKKNNLAKENVNTVNNSNTANETENGDSPLYSMDAVEQAVAMKNELLDMLTEVGEKLPPNTLDHLIDELGGTESVAEMTGRKGRVVNTDDGITYESRSEVDVPLEILNLTEKQRFMDGEKNVAIISEAASSGISLQADRRAINQRRRVHITLELPWSADRAIQQFGRTHRSNQVNAPEYMFLISELAGEQRFASTVSKRLESLGALTHGDRRATESRDLSRFNFDNKYGRTALEAVMKSVLGFDAPLVPIPTTYDGDFMADVKKGLAGVGLISLDDRIGVPLLEKDYNNISKFLNRILGMEVALQNALFRYFSDTLTAIILDAKRSGRWDMGILDLGSGGESVKKIETKTFVGSAAANTAKTELTTVSVERGMSFSQANDIWRKYTGLDDGFYISSMERNVKKTVILAVFFGTNKKREKLYNVYRPNTGRQLHPEPLSNIKRKYKKVLPDIAQPWWEDQYNLSAKICSHAYWRGSCKKANLGLPCEIGLRTRTFHILSGSVLSVWSKVESVLAAMPGGSASKMQIIRLKTDCGQRIVGNLIPGNCVQALTSILSEGCDKSFTEKHPQPVDDDEHLSMPLLF
ncbi:protein strawberry notch homolog 1-like [Saccostrea echinata]|uniref:protein strawberry notch homolog 1-like n=1 Tax=Saccostrea echinata TaxID=191078 RepID=UPI002A815667|nr:protein strawberry notch homolog 1-like [Saccostrea echinata]